MIHEGAIGSRGCMLGKVEGTQQICDIGKRMSKSAHFPAGD